MHHCNIILLRVPYIHHFNGIEYDLMHLFKDYNPKKVNMKPEIWCFHFPFMKDVASDCVRTITFAFINDASVFSLLMEILEGTIKRAGSFTFILHFLSETSPVAVSPTDARLAELQHYMQRETDALALHRDVVKQLQGISELDQNALAEVRCPLTVL